MSEHCRGCLVPGKYGNNKCFSRDFNKNGQCPCTDCLVKVTCNGDCDAYNDYAREITKMKRKTADEDIRDIGVMINLSTGTVIRKGKRDGT